MWAQICILPPKKTFLPQKIIFQKIYIFFLVIQRAEIFRNCWEIKASSVRLAVATGQKKKKRTKIRANSRPGETYPYTVNPQVLKARNQEKYFPEEHFLPQHILILSHLVVQKRPGVPDSSLPASPLPALCWKGLNSSPSLETWRPASPVPGPRWFIHG